MMDINKTKTFRSKTTIQIMISSFIFLSASILELYWIINRGYEYIILFVIGLIIILSGFCVLKGIKNEIDHYYEKISNQYDEIIKADKAVYLLVKKSFNELNEEFVKMMDTNGPISEIVEKQKTIAKLTISKNRQSIEEVLNSNLKVLEVLEKLSTYIESNEVNMNTKNTGKEKTDKVVPKLYDDPNTSLTTDEIAALFESMGT